MQLDYNLAAVVKWNRGRAVERQMRMAAFRLDAYPFCDTAWRYFCVCAIEDWITHAIHHFCKQFGCHIRSLI